MAWVTQIFVLHVFVAISQCRIISFVNSDNDQAELRIDQLPDDTYHIPQPLLLQYPGLLEDQSIDSDEIEEDSKSQDLDGTYKEPNNVFGSQVKNHESSESLSSEGSTENSLNVENSVVDRGNEHNTDTTENSLEKNRQPSVDVKGYENITGLSLDIERQRVGEDQLAQANEVKVEALGQGNSAKGGILDDESSDQEDNSFGSNEGSSDESNSSDSQSDISSEINQVIDNVSDSFENDSSIEMNKNKDESPILLLSSGAQSYGYNQVPTSNPQYYTVQQSGTEPVYNGPMYIPSNDLSSAQGQVSVPGNGQQYINSNSQPIQGNSPQYVLVNGQQYITGSGQPVQGNNQQYVLNNGQQYVISTEQPEQGNGQLYVLSNGQQYVPSNAQPVQNNDQQYILINGQQYATSGGQPVQSNGQQYALNNGQQFVNSGQPVQGNGQIVMPDNGQQYILSNGQPIQGNYQNSGQVYVPVNEGIQSPQSNVITVPSGSVVTVGDSVPFLVYKDKEDKSSSVSSSQSSSEEDEPEDEETNKDKLNKF